MQNLKQIFLGCYLFLIAGSASAENSGTVALENFFSNLKTLTAEFNQTVQNAQLSTVDRASGKLWIQRPGKFRWNYVTPYLQEIVSDGKKVWIYDSDLEQVTVKDATSALGQTPAMLLSGDKPVSESFTVIELDNQSQKDLSWVELTPKNDDAGFNGIRLGFNKGKLQEMLLQDNLGQITHLSLSHMEINPVVDTHVFEFKIPAGADVFESAE